MILCLLLTGNPPSPTGGKLCAICHQDTPLSFKNPAACGHRIPQLSWNSDPQVCLCALSWNRHSFVLTLECVDSTSTLTQVLIDQQFFKEDSRGYQRHLLALLPHSSSAEDGASCQRGSSSPGGPAFIPDSLSTGHW